MKKDPALVLCPRCGHGHHDKSDFCGVRKYATGVDSTTHTWVVDCGNCGWDFDVSSVLLP